MVSLVRDVDSETLAGLPNSVRQLYPYGYVG
jgi:hypothetical protein